VDEPTGGLDPEERVRFRNLLSELPGERIVILSTHIVSDVEAVATDIAIIARGRLVAHRAPEAWLKAVEGRAWEVELPSAGLPALRERHQVSATVRRGEAVQARVIADEAPGPGARPVPPTLEDAYLDALSAVRAGTAG
jgi:ABC-2 type transport system ATP-binding protein